MPGFQPHPVEQRNIGYQQQAEQDARKGDGFVVLGNDEGETTDKEGEDGHPRESTRQVDHVQFAPKLW